MANNYNKAWALFDQVERRRAIRVLFVMVLSGLMSAVMIASVMPFLRILSNSGEINSIPGLEILRDWAGIESEYSLLIATGLGSILIILVASSMQILRVGLVNSFILTKSHTLAKRLLENYLLKDYEYFLNRHTDEITTEILSETTEAVERFLRPAAEILASLWSIVMICALLFWVDFEVTLVLFASMSTVLWVLFRFTRRRLDSLGRLRASSNLERFKVVGEALDGIKEVKLLSAERFFLDRFTGPSSAMANASVSASLISQVPSYVIQALAFCGTIILCLALITPGSIESGNAVGEVLPLLGLYAFAGQRLLPEFNRVYFSLSAMRYGAGAISSIHAALSEFAKQSEANDISLSSSAAIKGTIEFHEIEYAYPGVNEPNLRIDYLQIVEGETIGVVGATGSGKTTFADLLLGLLIPNRGRILVGGNMLDQEKLTAWRKRIAYVPQEIFLRDASVAENIAFGIIENSINLEHVEKVSKIAQLDKFITEQLPASYQTKLGEKGIRLSGGQKQRLGIARALYHEADVLVLDEATSALDTVTESDVMSTISSLSDDKTVFIIAHRLSTLRECDRIIFFKEGRLAAVGSWSELIAQDPDFQQITLKS